MEGAKKNETSKDRIGEQKDERGSYNLELFLRRKHSLAVIFLVSQADKQVPKDFLLLEPMIWGSCPKQ